MIRAEWVERMTQRREALDLAAEFIAQGRSFVELDEDGNIVKHRARIDDQSSDIDPDLIVEIIRADRDSR